MGIVFSDVPYGERDDVPASIVGLDVRQETADPRPRALSANYEVEAVLPLRTKVQLSVVDAGTRWQNRACGHELVVPLDGIGWQIRYQELIERVSRYLGPATVSFSALMNYDNFSFVVDQFH